MNRPTQSGQQINQNFVAVKQASFIAHHEPIWHEFDNLIANNKRTIDDNYRLATLYRQICQHYALATQRHYSPLLIDRLHARVMNGHNCIYREKRQYINRFLTFVLYEFPNSVREHYRLFWACSALFYVPCIIFGLACYHNQELIYSIMSYFEVSMMESMYDPANEHIGRNADRQADTDIMMFGYYIFNNIGIDFKTYAAGIFFGIGTIFVTVYNGVVIGAVSGHLTGRGFGETFWQFVAGHGSFELTALVIATMAGLKLATPLIAPAPYSKKDAFKVAGKQSITLILGAGLMTFIAAFIEAFWSSSSVISPLIKYIVGLGLWVLVGWYLIFCGKQK